MLDLIVTRARLALVSALAIAVALGSAACSRDTGEADVAQERFQWKLVTSWPKNYPGLGKGPERLADWVDEMSDGRLRIKVYAAGELVPALEVFDAVSSGAVEIGHSAAYYWKGKIPALQFFTAIPFGLNAREMNAWMEYGGGLNIQRGIYSQFNIVPFGGGNTGVQMVGWFNREINSLEDLKGLKMRVPGLAGEIYSRLGVAAVTLPAGELYTSMQTGVVDAVEWVGPYNDRSLGLHEVGKYYYYPGWHEPGARLEFIVHRRALDSLPKDLSRILKTAMRAINQSMLDEYTYGNALAFAALSQRPGVEFRSLPEEVIAALRETSAEVISEIVAKDHQAFLAYDSARHFLAQSLPYRKVSEDALLEVRRELRKFPEPARKK